MAFLLKSPKRKSGLRRYMGPKRLVILLLLSFLVVWAWNSYQSGELSPELIEHYRSYNPTGSILLFIAIYAVSVIFAVPSLPLNLAAGFFWGGIIGGIYSTIGVTVGGWVSFLAARYLIGQPLATRCEYKLVTRIQDEFDSNGWKFVAFARINPIFPTGPLNYILGLTSLSNRGFLWATFLFLLPPSIAVAYIGDTLQTFVAQQSDVTDIIRGILITSGAITFLAIAKYSSKFTKNEWTSNENNTLSNDP